jgi:lysyl-tRNA synthetase class 2
LVGGFDKVYEINRSFRNEGLSTKHNPEFTMMEWYEAYATMQNQMDLTKDIIVNAAKAIDCGEKIEWDELEIDLGKFSQEKLSDLVLSHNNDLNKKDLNDRSALEKYFKGLGKESDKSWGKGRLLLEIFEETVEERLINPTFVTEYPVEVSPLSRRNPDNPDFADRFELFIGGKEFANGFCELNDPDDQASRFEAQVAAKDSGDKEAMDFDKDYITALEHGMPPAVGVGLGIDRLVMLLTNQSSIRDVLLFPQLKN